MSIISAKTRKFIDGRRGQFPRIEAACRGQHGIVWVHSASYGEFEEVRPVVAALRAAKPEVKILVTFFSPSGYEYLKDDPIADWVFYIPIDTRRNARRFLDAVRPEKVIISISDYWLNFLHELRSRGIDTYLTSARYEPDMFYFKPLGFVYRDAFRTCFKRIFVRDKQSLDLLEGIGATNAVLMGDPRLDRVLEIAAEPWSDPVVDAWAGGRKVFVAGSTLPDEDDELMIALANAHPSDKFMIIPHEIDRKQIDHLRASIAGGCSLYTEGGGDSQVLIVDTVGMLSRLYRYGFASYVGAGFDGGPHSVIEPAAYGIPVSYGPEFGPQYHCQLLIDCGAACSVGTASEMCVWYDKLVSDNDFLLRSGAAARDYCVSGSDVARRIAQEIV